MHVSTGKGVSRVLTDRRVQEVVAAARRRFKNGDYEGGLLEALKKVDEFLVMGPPALREKVVNFASTWGIFIGIFGFFAYQIVR